MDDETRERFDRVDERFDRVDERLDGISAELTTGVTGQLTSRSVPEATS